MRQIFHNLQRGTNQCEVVRRTTKAAAGIKFLAGTPRKPLERHTSERVSAVHQCSTTLATRTVVIGVMPNAAVGALNPTAAVGI